MQDYLPDEASDVLEYWYDTLSPEQWWCRDGVVDREITARFAGLYARLANEVPQKWLSSPLGRLAAIITLDQFPRNMFRDDPQAFATDKLALQVARNAIIAGDDQRLTREQRSFLYMPFQHSEDSDVQAESVALFKALGDANQIDFAEKHKVIVDRFGRFPHRNDVLARNSTSEETEFLKQPGLFW